LFGIYGIHAKTKFNMSSVKYGEAGGIDIWSHPKVVLLNFEEAQFK
jgi:hypothetical protein